MNPTSEYYLPFWLISFQLVPHPFQFAEQESLHGERPNRRQTFLDISHTTHWELDAARALPGLSNI